jgi:hypothetical protein
MSKVRTVVIASLVVAAIVAACTSPSSPPDASPSAKLARTARARAAHVKRFSPLVACEDNTVEVSPCDGTDTLAKNSTADTIIFSYTNNGTQTYDFDTDCAVDGTVVLSCTPEDSIFEITAHHSIKIHYRLSTRAAAGTGSVEATVDNLGNDDQTGSFVTIVTH